MRIGGGSCGDGGDGGGGDPQKDLAWRRPLIASILYIVPSQQWLFLILYFLYFLFPYCVIAVQHIKWTFTLLYILHSYNLYLFQSNLTRKTEKNGQGKPSFWLRKHSGNTNTIQTQQEHETGTWLRAEPPTRHSLALQGSPLLSGAGTCVTNLCTCVTSHKHT